MSQVQLNRSDVALYVPASLLSGALFYNSADNKLYVGGPSGLPMLISDDPSVISTQLSAVEATNTAQDSQIAALAAASNATTVSASQPTSAVSGDLWFDTTTGNLNIYTTEWVLANDLHDDAGSAGVYPISSEEFFEHIIFTPSESETLQGLNMVAAATAWAEMYTGRFFITRTVTHAYDSFPSLQNGSKQPLRLMGQAVNDILGVTYSDSSYVSQTLAATGYRNITKNSKTHLYPAMGTQWPTDVATGEPDVINVTYTVGTLPSGVPAPVKAAILLIAASLWENRENEIVGTNIKALKPTIAAKDLLHPYKLR